MIGYRPSVVPARQAGWTTLAHRSAIALLAVLGVAVGCGGGGEGAGLVPGPKHFTPEAVNALHPGMSEKEVVALLDRWDQRDDQTPEFRGLEYDALANNPDKGVLILNVWLKKGRLWQVYAGTLNYDTPASGDRPARTGANLLRPCSCLDDSVRRVTGSEQQCQANWATSCLALIDPPVKTCAGVDLPGYNGSDGRQLIEVLFDPVERRPGEAEEWERRVRSSFYDGWGRVRLAWRAGGWHVQSACLKWGVLDPRERELATRLPPRDVRQEVGHMLHLTDENEP